MTAQNFVLAMCLSLCPRVRFLMIQEPSDAFVVTAKVCQDSNSGAKLLIHQTVSWNPVRADLEEDYSHLSTSLTSSNGARLNSHLNREIFSRLI